jgi:hypothetical protein
MRRVGALLSISILTIFFLTTPARAAEPGAVIAVHAVHEVHASAGRFNVLNHDPLPEAGWEVSFAPRKLPRLPRWVPVLAPAVGGMATSDGSYYAYAGFRWDVPLGEAWRLTPQWAAGLYYTPPGGRSLGGPVNFRSGIELSRRVGKKGRLGLLFYHVSNSALYERNPGSESLLLTYGARP